jgi:iron(III) transport system permease protein
MTTTLHREDTASGEPTPTRERPSVSRRFVGGGRTGWTLAALVAAVLVAVPVLMLAASILTPSGDVWAQQWRTRLPGELRNTAVLLVGVAVGTVVLGAGMAWLVSAYRFPGSKQFGWMLILPLAMPSYILGFLTLSTVGRTGPVQDWWREQFGRDAWFPDVESLGGAIITFTLVMYPYVYLLARAALRDQASGAYQAARTLGATRAEASRRIVLPLVRPAVAAGAAIVIMETLTDFATVTYFGVDTVSVGVFQIWRGTYDRDAASEIATLVLAFALLAIGLERVARGRARFAQSTAAGAGIEPIRLRGGRAVLATGTCVLLLLAAFVGPVLRLVLWAIQEQRSVRGTPQIDQFGDYLANSLQLVVFTVVVCITVAVVLANAQRFGRPRLTRFSTRVTAMGYAVPGPVVAIGVILAVVGFDELLGRVGLELPGAARTGSLLILVYAYAVRFLAPGLTAVESGIGQVSDEVTASARTLGANTLETARRVHLPLTRSALLAATVLVGVDALKELPIVLLLRPFGFDTLPVWVYLLASESRFQQAALPSLSIIAVALLPVALLARRLDRNEP